MNVSQQRTPPHHHDRHVVYSDSDKSSLSGQYEARIGAIVACQLTPDRGGRDEDAHDSALQLACPAISHICQSCPSLVPHFNRGLSAEVFIPELCIEKGVLINAHHIVHQILGLCNMRCHSGIRVHTRKDATVPSGLLGCCADSLHVLREVAHFLLFHFHTILERDVMCDFACSTLLQAES